MYASQPYAIRQLYADIEFAISLWLVNHDRFDHILHRRFAESFLSRLRRISVKCSETGISACEHEIDVSVSRA